MNAALNTAPVPNISRPARTVDADGLDRFDRKFRDSVFSAHDNVRPLLSATFRNVLKHKSKRDAALSLVEFRHKMERGDLWLSKDDSELKDWCQDKARACRLTVSHRGRDALSIQRRIVQVLAKYGLDFPYEPVNDLFRPYRGFEVAYARVSDAAWWLRQVRTLQRRELEEYQRKSGMVHHKNQIYCSDYAVKARRQQKLRNRALLSEIKCTNQFGDEYWLDELQDLSVSNPALRRGELMVRIAGFEEYARRRDYVGEFLTVTCPSKYHSTHVWGEPNANFQGFTARQSNEYLCNLWALIRAKLHRNGVDVFGFRIAEPHHDGCPHWHFLLFMDPRHADYVARVFRAYAMREDGGEPGAYKHRFKRESIDPRRGSAAGYVAKYVAKNIDGEGVDNDLFGNDAGESARRVDAWASTHGIRQFQQIGGASVTVWRELRRLEEQDGGLIERARLAADTANWADFCELMGSGREQAITLAHWQELDLETGETDPAQNKYGAPVPSKVFGLVSEGVAVCTRVYSWVLTRVRNAFDVDFQGANAPPWSSVNNCTGVPG